MEIKKNNKPEIKLGITIICMVAVCLLSIVGIFFPQSTLNVMGKLMSFVTNQLGWVFYAYVFFAFAVILFFSVSKYGNIKLGGGKPKYSKLQLFSMTFAAGMGGSTMYWAFIESTYYYMSPQFGMVDKAEIMEQALAFNFNHWGFSGWAVYTICAVPFLLMYYAKKRKDLSLAGVTNSLFDDKLSNSAKSGIDLLFLIVGLGAVAVTLGLAIPMISGVVAGLFNIKPTMLLGIGLILGITVVFSLSSFVGLDKGMAKFSDWTVKLAFLLLLVVFIFGPTTLIINNTINATGIFFDDFFRMSLNTDPFGKSGFPQGWTIYFIANWASYGPGMGVFLTKVSKGHKLRDVLILVMVAGPLGCFVLHGVCNTFTLDLMNNGVVDAVAMLNAGNASGLVFEVLNTLPLPSVMVFVYLMVMMLFTVTTLDANAFSLASVASKKLGKDGSPSPWNRIVWCVLLVAIPIVFVLIGADMSVIKVFPMLVLVPMVPLYVIIAYKAVKYAQDTFGHMDNKEIDAWNAQLDVEEEDDNKKIGTSNAELAVE